MASFKMKTPDCERFSGYKPCIPYKTCYESCSQPDKPFGTRILIINLDAMGDVLMTTAQLEPIKRKYPDSYIAWLTLKSAVPLLQENPLIDEVFVWDPEDWLILQGMKFDLILNADKSRRSGALTMKLKAKEKLGFGMNELGHIIPLNKEAEYNYRLGLDDYMKFRVNQRTGQDILSETFKLSYERDEYVLNLTEDEKALTAAYRKSLGIRDDEVVVGFNTGCSNLFPNKKLSLGQHADLIEKFSGIGSIKLLLLGGREDTERNEQIYSDAVATNPQLLTRLFKTPTTGGIRKGIVYENAADIVITGDSYGMHLAIALKKIALVWFGVSCPAEIDLYDRGTKFIPEDLFCSPCWKKTCPYDLECMKMVDLDKMFSVALQYADQIMSKKRSSEKATIV